MSSIIDSGKIAILATLVLGVVILGVGCHAYFKSQWYKFMTEEDNSYEQCKDLASEVEFICPPLALETYFVSITIITFILSGASLVASFFVQNDSLKRGVSIFNIAAGVLIMLGAITVITSAVLIKKLVESIIDMLGIPNIGPIIGVPTLEVDRNTVQYFDEKIAAGVLSFINVIVYISAGILGCKSTNIK